MATIPVNLKKTPDHDALPKGEYLVKILEREERTASTGKVGDRWTFEVRESGDYYGRRVWNTTYRTPDSLWKLKGLCAAVGYEGTAVGVDDEFLIGKMLKISIDRVERNGRVFNEVLTFKAATPEELQVAAASDVPF